MNRRRIGRAVHGRMAALMCVLLLLGIPGMARAAESAYDRAVAALSAQEIQNIRDACLAYNASLENIVFSDPFSDGPTGTSAEYQALLDPAGDGVMGRLEIPAIDVTLPICHAGRPEGMASGVAHVEGTSLPVGGASSNCVLAGHRGLPGAALLTDLDRLAEGDLIVLSVLGENLNYRVDAVRVVSPEEVDASFASADAEGVTIVTEAPFGVNSHRLLVHGARQ